MSWSYIDWEQPLLSSIIREQARYASAHSDIGVLIRTFRNRNIWYPLPITRTLEGNRKKVLVTRVFEVDSPTQAHKQMDVEGIQISCSLLFREARDIDWYFEKVIKQQSLIKIQGQTLNLNLPVEWQKCKDKELTRLFWNKFNVSDFSTLSNLFSNLSRA